jgi:hypothetical protein
LKSFESTTKTRLQSPARQRGARQNLSDAPSSAAETANRTNGIVPISDWTYSSSSNIMQACQTAHANRKNVLTIARSTSPSLTRRRAKPSARLSPAKGKTLSRSNLVAVVDWLAERSAPPTCRGNRDLRVPSGRRRLGGAARRLRFSLLPPRSQSPMVSRGTSRNGGEVVEEPACLVLHLTTTPSGPIR